MGADSYDVLADATNDSEWQGGEGGGNPPTFSQRTRNGPDGKQTQLIKITSRRKKLVKRIPTHVLGR